jgi:hypothetical protein
MQQARRKYKPKGVKEEKHQSWCTEATIMMYLE